MMLRNIFKISLRTTLKSPVNSTIKFLGLALSMTAILFICLWVQDEISYNRHFTKGEDLYKVYMGFVDADKRLDPWSTASYPLAKAIKAGIPAVKDVAIFTRNYNALLDIGLKQQKASGINAEYNLFDLFDIRILAGNIFSAADDPDAIVITDELQKNLFGDLDAGETIGMTIEIDKQPYKVSAICEKLPANSTVRFDFARTLAREAQWNANHWGNHSYHVYAYVPGGAYSEDVLDKATSIYANSNAYDEDESLIMHPLSKEYLFSEFNQNGIADGGRIEYVRIFTIAALFLFLIAVINFVNISTAESFRRSKEVGVRKVIGAGRKSLLFQFLSESFLTAAIAACIAVFLYLSLSPYFNTLTGKDIGFDLYSIRFWAVLSSGVIATGLLAGFYPALVLSSIGIQQVFRKEITKVISQTSLQKALLVIQFALSLFLISGAFIVKDQVNYILNKNIGLEKNNIVYIPLEGGIRSKTALLTDRLRSYPEISDISYLSENPVAVNMINNGVSWPGKTDDEWHIHFHFLLTDYNFPEFFNIPLKSGRYYREEMAADSTAVVVNEMALEVMGVSLDEAVGTEIEVWDQSKKIIGVMENFHTASFHKEIGPVLTLLHHDWSRNALFAKSDPNHTSRTIQVINSEMKSIDPNYESNYQFLDEAFAAQYRNEQITSVLAGIFAGFSILIACLGLFGLISISGEKRAREIGIRKVMGAGVINIIGLLSRDLLLLVFISTIIALPFTWYVLKNWLENYAFHTDLSWKVFVIAGACTTGLALFTMTMRSIKSARANPVESLQSE